ncbi:MAG TPA: ATP-binding protein [Candidatus Polarisedimenticolia bacterium]|nr:ATP-binding protein [Candidatus Polarisedimenticolia bacterium]
MLPDVRRRLADVDRPSAARSAIVALAGLVIGSALVAVLQGPPLAIRDPSPIYLVVVVVVGAVAGTGPALVTAAAAFLVYDFLFTAPRFSLRVDDSQEWLDLVLFLVVAVVVGRLAAASAERGRVATRRAAVASALFSVSRQLAVAPSTAGAATDVVNRLAIEGALERVTIAVGEARAPRVLADTAPTGTAVPSAPIVLSLNRTPGDEPATWVRAHEPGAHRAGIRDGAMGHDVDLLRVRIEADGDLLGWLLAIRRRASAPPDRDVTRLLALAADQVGLGLRRDQLLTEATEAEVARRSDALRSALLDSVTHDLRTPLASIRAAAGSLADPDQPLTDEARRAAAAAIDAEAERLDRTVRSVLDLSRIEAGALRPEREVFELGDVAESVLERWRERLGDRPIDVDLPANLPPVEADGRFLDSILSNLFENVARHAPAPAAMSISARRRDDDSVELDVEDGGPGVSDDVRARMFEKFYRVPGRAARTRPGLGIGLSLVRGFAEAMGGRVEADRSRLGGLAVRIVLPAAPPAPGEAS